MPQITYAIGDVHGCAGLPEPMLEAIEHDSRESGSTPRVLFLGDIVDRGPESRQFMDLVCEILAKWVSSKLILGNHDAYFLEFMTAEEADERRLMKWLIQGGHQTLDS